MFNFSNGSDERVVENCYKTYVVTKPTTSYIANNIAGSVVNFALCLLGTFLNALVIYVFWKTPRFRYKVSYFMIMLLSSNDILVTIIIHPLLIILAIAESVGTESCLYRLLYHALGVLLSGISFMTLFVMNIERYLSIVHPFFHRRHVTKTRCLILCAILWLAPISFMIVRVQPSNTQRMITALALIVLIGTFYIYLAIFYVARKRKRSQQLNVRKEAQDKNNSSQIDSGLSTQSMELSKDASVDTPVDSKDISVDTPVDTVADQVMKGQPSKADDLSNNQEAPKCDKPEEDPKSSKALSFLHEIQLAKMYLLVLCSSIVLQLPNAVVLAMFPGEVNSINGLVQSKIWINTLVMMNSTVNCLIFFWANKRLRKEGRDICKRLFKRS